MGSLFDGGRQMEGTMYVGADGILWFSIDRERSYFGFVSLLHVSGSAAN